MTIDKWDLVDNSISFYTTPYAGSRIYIEVATTSEEFGGTMIQPSVEQAETAAAEASASAEAALVSETNASTSATNAATSESNVSASATSASTSATNASASATSASTSATNASTAQTGAETAEANAIASQNAAATSETNAATSASSASTSASNAATSETNAATSAAEAAASAASIDPATLVSRTSSTGSAVMPSGTTAQRDGTPSTGYSRFNADEGYMEYYDGTVWIPSGKQEIQVYDLVANTSISFTGLPTGTYSWLVELSANGFTVTWDASVEWDGDGTEPEWTTGADLIFFYTLDGGTTIKGMQTRAGA